MVVDEFALKAMVEQEDDDILISKVMSRSSSSNSQNDKLQLCKLPLLLVLFMLISQFASLHDQFNTWSEFETSPPKSLKVEKCTTAVRSGWSHIIQIFLKKGTKF